MLMIQTVAFTSTYPTRLQLRPFLSPFLPIFISQQSSQYLPARRLWNHINELDLCEPFVPCLVLFHILLDLTNQHAVIVL